MKKCRCLRCRERECEARTIRMALPFIEVTPEQYEDPPVLQLLAALTIVLSGLDDLVVKVGEEGRSREWVEAG